MGEIKQRGRQGSKGPGRTYRRGITQREFHRQYPDEASAREYFIQARWGGEQDISCPRCGSENTSTHTTHPTMPYRCRARGCRKYFSVKTGTPMEGSKLGCLVWLEALHLHLTSIKNISAMKLRRDLGISYKSAWFVAHRLREVLALYGPDKPLSGELEADEKYLGGRKRNMHAQDPRRDGQRGASGKVAVAGLKERGTGHITVKRVRRTTKGPLQGFVRDNVVQGSTVYTDEHPSYVGLSAEFIHEAVQHGVGEYVRKAAHTNGIEGFWSLVEKAYVGTHHKFSAKHTERQLRDLAGKHNMRELDTGEQLTTMVKHMEGKRLRYRDLIADNGWASGARPCATRARMRC